MLKIGDTQWNKADASDRITYCKNGIDATLTNRRRYDWKWYLARRFQAGDQYVYWNSVSNQIENPPRRRGALRIVLNKIKPSTRAIKNFIASSQPKWEVIPGDTDEDTITNARRAGKLLDYISRKTFMLNKIRTGLSDVVDTSVAFFEWGWDDKAEKGLGQVELVTHNPFEIIIPLSAYVDGPVIHAPFIAKVSRIDVEEIRNDERYDEKARKKVGADDELAASEFQKKLIRNRGEQGDKTEGQKTVLRYEVFLWDAEGNDEGGNVTIYTFADNQELRNEQTDMTEFPIMVLQDEPRRQLYSDCPITWSLIPPQKGKNRLASQKLENNNLFNRARVLADKGHGIKLAATGRVGADEVEVLEKNPGKEVDWWQPHPISDAGQETAFDHDIEDISGVYEAMKGVNPAGGRSGEMLEQLQAAGANNLIGLQMSLECFLSALGERVLNTVSEKYVASRVIKLTEPEEGKDYTKVIGENAPEKPDGATIISEDNEVIVKIGSWLGYTREAQRKTLSDMVELGAIPREEMLRYYEFPNIDELSRKAREERLEEHEMEAEIAGRREAQQGAAEPAAQTPETMIADEENVRMMNGEALPPTPNATPEHTQVHIDFMNTPDARERPDVINIILNHARGEEAARGGAIA